VGFGASPVAGVAETGEAVEAATSGAATDENFCALIRRRFYRSRGRSDGTTASSARRFAASTLPLTAQPFVQKFRPAYWPVSATPE